jgi:hypothetical protein
MNRVTITISDRDGYVLDQITVQPSPHVKYGSNLVTTGGDQAIADDIVEQIENRYEIVDED